MTAKKKNVDQGKRGSKGYRSLVEKVCTPEAIAKFGSKKAVMSDYFKKKAKKRWKVHPEQRSKKNA